MRREGCNKLACEMDGLTGVGGGDAMSSGGIHGKGRDGGDVDHVACVEGCGRGGALDKEHGATEEGGCARLGCDANLGVIVEDGGERGKGLMCDGWGFGDGEVLEIKNREKDNEEQGEDK